MRQINDFVRRFDASIDFDEQSIIMKKERYFIVNPRMKELTQDFYCAGTYLGKIKKGVFFPSFPLLTMISEKKANKVVVNRRTEWLFVCGRDVFGKGIVKVIGSRDKGALTLILNENNECLGFGKMVRGFNESMKGVAVRNIADVGDFLRRERNVKTNDS